MGRTNRPLVGILFAATVFALGLVASASADEPQAKTSHLSSTLAWPEPRVLFDASEDKIRKALETPAEFEFDGTPLGDVMAHLANKLSISIQLDTEALAADGKGFD